MKNKDFVYIKKKGKIVVGKIDIRKDTCPGCGFVYGGIFRVHNVWGECSIMNGLKVKEIINQISK